MRFDALKAVGEDLMVVWVVTPCRLNAYIFRAEDGDSVLHRKLSTYRSTQRDKTQDQPQTT
jgi:hypothetical protein